MFNFLNFEKIIYYYEKIDKIKKNIPQFPIHFTISLGNFCNHKCLWCTAYKDQLKDSKYINLSELINFLKKAKKKGLKAVTYIGNGEPTTYPNFRELINKVSNIGLEQAMFTNGYLIDKYEDEILNYFTWVRVSLDAGSETTHNYLHDVNGHFPKILNNLGKLVKKRKGFLPTIGVQFAVHHKNIYDLYSAAQIVSEIGVDYFCVKPVFNRGAVGERIEKNKLTFEDINPIVKKIKFDMENKLKIFFRPFQVISNQKNCNIFNYSKCYAGFFNLNIYEDNKIVICGPNRISIGKIEDNINDLEFKILNFSKTLNVKKCPAGCRYHALNNLIDNILFQKNIKENHINFI